MTSPLLKLRQQFYQTRCEMAMLLGCSIVGYSDREAGIMKLLPSEGRILSATFGVDGDKIVAQQDRYVSEVLAGLSDWFYDGVRRV